MTCSRVIIGSNLYIKVFGSVREANNTNHYTSKWLALCLVIIIEVADWEKARRQLCYHSFLALPNCTIIPNYIHHSHGNCRKLPVSVNRCELTYLFNKLHGGNRGTY